MVNLTLSNKNQNSPYKQAIINLATGTSTIDDSQDIPTKSLLNMDFSHPLLTHPVLSSTGHSYTYQYDDVDGLLDAAKYIYATLIHADNPLDCIFDVAPSNDFSRLKAHYKIPFSANCKKPATELVEVEQFNAMISRFGGLNFRYQDTIVLEQTITLKNLPSTVDGDWICQTDLDTAQFCKQADAMHKYEIRYINRFVGFGVFAREDIQEGERIAQYCGIKQIVNRVDHTYEFSCDRDVFNFVIDSANYGNIARFINHAPKNASDLQSKSSRNALESNIITDRQGLYGNDVVIYVAKNTILKGEQLLIDYGPKYFGGYDKACSVKRNGTFIGLDNKPVKETRQQRRQALAVMSECGFKQAQWYLVRKPLVMLVITLLSAFLLSRS